MIYFCADDYGMSDASNRRIENCIQNGILNKVSVLPNGIIADFKQRLGEENTEISLHLNLVEGYPLSKLTLLSDEKGCFKYSFVGLLLLSLSGKRKVLEKELYTEIQSQIKFWKKQMGESTSVSVDSHQHVHMIPLVFKTLMRVIRDENLKVHYIRIPAEPILPYVLTPSLYLSYSPTGLVKQWLLKFLIFVNGKEIKKAAIPTAYFMGVLFSGRMSEKNVSKILPKYIKLAKRKKRNIELGFHPGYSEQGEKLFEGCRAGFSQFYASPWRKTEYDALMNLKF